MTEKPETLIHLRRRLLDQIHALDKSAIVAITDEKGVITYVNDKFCELSGYTSDELLGQTHAIVNSHHHDRAFFIDMWQTIAQGKVWRAEIRNRAKQGHFYWVDTTIVPFLNPEGGIEQYIAIRYDITEKKQTEATLLKERQLLIESEKMASIGVLAAGIAHELGNPLGAIRGRLEMLESMLNQDDFSKENAGLFVQKMVQSVDRMSKIIRGLKSYSRDGTRDPKQKFDICQLIGDITEVSSEKFLKNNIKVSTRGIKKPIFIFGRETEIGQVVVNLFNNAVDAIKGEKDPWIAIEVLESDNHCTLFFKDSGPGIPEAILHKIFDPFYTTKEVGQGTGLGLSICRSLVEDHQGTLSYDQESDVTSFKLVLPKKNSAPDKTFYST